MTETVSTPTVAPSASIRRERAGATAAPRPVSKRPVFSSRMSVRTALFSVASASSRVWIGPRFPASIAADSSRVLADVARRDLRAVLELAEQPGAERRAADSRASVLPCSDAAASTKPTVATTTIGRMTRTMKKMVSRCESSFGHRATGEPSRTTATIGRLRVVR